MALIIPGDLFKGVSIIDEVSDNLTYVGYPSRANPSESEAKWAIKRIEKTGSVTRIAWAGGMIDKKFIWDNRTSYAYHYIL